MVQALGVLLGLTRRKSTKDRNGAGVNRKVLAEAAEETAKNGPRVIVVLDDEVACAGARKRA